jgi:hypothetical protein
MATLQATKQQLTGFLRLKLELACSRFRLFQTIIASVRTHDLRLLSVAITVMAFLGAPGWRFDSEPYLQHQLPHPCLILCSYA